jgi:DNA replication and repair protein RecF
VRGFASQGQHRAVVLSLKLAELLMVAAVTQSRPVLVLDDVSGELDAQRSAALFRALRDLGGQVFLSTTHPELIPSLGPSGSPRQDFTVSQGIVREVPGGLRM